jgi:hypothetical protein
MPEYRLPRRRHAADAKAQVEEDDHEAADLRDGTEHAEPARCIPCRDRRRLQVRSIEPAATRRRR